MSHENWMQAQYSVLGSVLIEPDLVPKLIHQSRRSDFTGECCTVYTAMIRLFQDGTPVDPVTVVNALGGQYRDFIVQLMEVTPTAANFEYYLQICREQAKVQAVRGIAQQILTAENSEQVRKLLEGANEMMLDKPSLRIVTMKDALQSFMDRHSGEVNYLSWPIMDLNARLFVEAGDLVLLGGFPSAGKSALSLQCARHWAKQMKVGFFSLETSPEKLMDRMMSSIAQINLEIIKRNQLTESQWLEMVQLAPMVENHNLELIPAASMSVADVRSVTMMRRYDLIIIDYVQLLSATGSSRFEQVTNISLALHRMAQDLGVTVVALSQLKRKNDDSTPESSDLRESGQLEQDADVIMMLKLEHKDHPEGNRKLYITKNKEGTCPMITLAFDGKHQTFAKAAKTGDIVQKLSHDAKKAQRSREAAPVETQMTMLPENTKVPI